MDLQGLPKDLPPLELIDRLIMERSLSHFLRAGWEVLEPATPLVWNWHLDVLCDHLQALIEDGPGTPQNVLINVPPGTMKSLIMSVFLPAWVWLRRPSWRAIYASGTPSVVTRDSLKCRTLIKSDWYQKTFKPQWQISADQDEKQHFATTAGGFRKGLGAGGTVTGERADFLGVDDPNDAKEIHSKAHREAINDRWWSAAFQNRIASPAKSKRCIIMQRLHQEDLAGYVLDRETGQWAHLSIPMEYEKDRAGDKPTWLGWTDPRTSEGALLFEEMFPQKFLRAMRVAYGSAGYAGQMQQRPVPAEGNNFKRDWWRFWSPTGTAAHRDPRWSQVPPKRYNPAIDIPDERLMSWDCTFKDTDGTDWVVGICLDRVGADKFLLARCRKRMGFTETRRAIAQMTLDWPDAYRKLIEDKANGSAIIETLTSEITGIVAVEPKGGKEARAAAIEPQVEAGTVYLPEGAEWLEEWIEEFASFPLGKHDDQVDSLSQALIELMETGDVAAARALLGMTR